MNSLADESKPHLICPQCWGYEKHFFHVDSCDPSLRGVTVSVILGTDAVSGLAAAAWPPWSAVSCYLPCRCPRDHIPKTLCLGHYFFWSCTLKSYFVTTIPGYGYQGTIMMKEIQLIDVKLVLSVHLTDLEFALHLGTFSTTTCTQ